MAVNARIIMQDIKCNQKIDGTFLSVVKSGCMIKGGTPLIDLKIWAGGKVEFIDDTVKLELDGAKTIWLGSVRRRGHKRTPIKGDQHINATTTTRNVSFAVLNSSLSWKNWNTLDAFRETLNESRLAT